MNNKGELTLGGIVIMIMAIFAGLALLGGIFDQQAVMTTKAITTDESIDIEGAYDGGAVNESYEFTVTNYPSGWKITECPLTSIAFSNSSGSAYTLTTDYVITASGGNFTLVNTDLVNQTFLSDNITYVDYTWCRDGYNSDSGSRSIAGMIGLFGALALVAFLIGMGIKEWVGK